MGLVESIEYLTGTSIYVLLGLILVFLVLAWYLRKPEPETRSVPVFTPRPKPKPKAKQKGRPCTIFFASQTGTAEDFAISLESEGNQFGFGVEVINMEDYDPEDLAEEKLVMFVVSTYGEGEPTDNAKDFYDWLCDEDREPDLLEGVEFTVFGLGNKTYEHYNQQGRAFNKRLEQLGAKRVYKYGEGDDDSSLEDDFAGWKKDLWTSLCSHYGMKVNTSNISDHIDARYTLKTHPADAKTVAHRFPNDSNSAYDMKNPAFCRITVNRELHSEESDRSCRHIEIDIGSKLSYEPGDHLGIFPENNAELVELYAKRIGADLNSIVSLVQSNGSRVLGPCTVRYALTAYCDLTSIPRKHLLQVLAEYTKNAEEKAALQHLASEAGQAKYTAEIKDNASTTLEVLNRFSSCQPPLGHLLEALPKLSPRYYSISSSLKANPKSVHVTAVLVEFTSPTGRHHLGVATTWLSKLKEGHEIPCYVRKSAFRLPPKVTTPVVMVGPGTGLAPFRGFIQERTLQRTEDTPLPPHLNTLYFGCRSRNVDFLYKDELENAVKTGVIELHTAFSREQATKVYVQHLLEQRGEETWKLIESGAYVYVCGDARVMAKDVHSVLEKITVTYGGKSVEEATAFITQLQKNGRYMQDVWY